MPCTHGPEWHREVCTLPEKQCAVTDCSMRKKLVLCSGKTSRSLLIMSSVHSNSASKIGGTSSVASDWRKERKDGGRRRKQEEGEERWKEQG